MISLIRELPTYVIIGIALVVFIVAIILIRVVLSLYLRYIIKKLLSIGIFTDARVNILRIVYHDKDDLKIGLCNERVSASNQAKLVCGELRTRNIVQLEQRKTGDYWILTELGKRVILYLEKNQQVLDRKGSLSQ